MANTLTGAIRAAIGLNLTGDNISLGTQKGNLPFHADLIIGSGTGANQSDLCYYNTRTLSASGTENLDLAGGLTDPIGDTLAFVEVTAILVRAAAGNGGNIVIGGAGSNTFDGPFDDSSDKINIPAGQAFLVTNLGAGWAVTAGTGDILLVENDDSGAAASYDIVIVGRSA